MPKEITAYQAKDGSLHDSACSAATRDVELMVQSSPLAENQPFAKELVSWLCKEASPLIDVLTDYHDACPVETEEGTQDFTGHRLDCAYMIGNACDCGGI
jgi:hypothetical protein